MTDKTRKYFSGASLEAAVLEAARYFGVDPERLAYERHAKRHGFLRGRRSVVIEVDPQAASRAESAERQPERQPEPVERASDSVAVGEREPEPSSPASVAGPPEQRLSEPEKAPPPADHPRRPADDPELEAAVHDALDSVFELAGLDLEAEVFQGDERVEVELSGRDEARLLVDRGALIIAIQHLLPRLARGLIGRSVPCRVDSGGFHESRRNRLLGLAERSAADVRRSGKPWVFDPMSPDERRIIHLALADEPDVETESHGRGFFKRVTVRAVRDRAAADERYNR